MYKRFSDSQCKEMVVSIGNSAVVEFIAVRDAFVRLLGLGFQMFKRTDGNVLFLLFLLFFFVLLFFVLKF